MPKLVSKRASNYTLENLKKNKMLNATTPGGIWAALHNAIEEGICIAVCNAN